MNVVSRQNQRKLTTKLPLSDILSQGELCNVQQPSSCSGETHGQYCKPDTYLYMLK